jgi:hypothetical protein
MKLVIMKKKIKGKPRKEKTKRSYPCIVFIKLMQEKVRWEGQLESYS